MKTAILCIAIVAGLAYATFRPIKDNRPTSPVKTDSLLRPSQRPIRLVFLQDVSGSTISNGVNPVSSDAFDQYFNETGRTVEIYFGIVGSEPSDKFISVNLPKATFKRPCEPALRGLSILEQSKVKEQYLADVKAYAADSVHFVADRKQRMRVFLDAVDSCQTAYRKKLATNTDLYTAVKIADEIFNYSEADSARNVLLINSDGFDTYRREVTKLQNRADVYLIGANTGERTSIDSIVTKRFAYPKQAILFSLKN